MRFESPWMFLLLVPVAGMVAFGLYSLLRKPAHLDIPTVRHATAAGSGFRGRMAHLPAVLTGIAAVLAVVALARPQVQDHEELVGEGADFVIALDMSASMNAVDMPAEDILSNQAAGHEPPNRFESARQILKKFISSRDMDRVGLVIFASKAYVKFPLTLDRDAMTRILDGLVLDDRMRSQDGNCVNGCTITGEQTAIGDALARAFKRIEDSKTKSRNIILITDGDNNAGMAAPTEIADFIALESGANPVRVFTFLVGGCKDTWMPAFNGFSGDLLKAGNGMQVYEPVKDQAPVKPDLLREIAEKTGGRFFAAPSESDFRKEFSDLEKTEFSAPALQAFREAYAWPLAAALVLYVAGLALGTTIWRRWP